MRIIAQDFQRRYPDVTVKVLPSIGSTGGLMALKKNRIDIGLSIRRFSPEELGDKIIEEPYGRTAVIFGVRESNPIDGLTLKEIEDIYSGKIKKWSDGTPVRLVIRPRSETFSKYLENINSGLKSASETSRSIPGVFVGITDQDAANQIEKTPGSFGITSMAIVSTEKRKIKAVSIDGIAPTLANISEGLYPYSITSYFLYDKDNYKGTLKSFLEFIFSQDGERILLDNGQVPLSMGRMME
jgi:phosphate transport system substrate-binding protein